MATWGTHLEKTHADDDLMQGVVRSLPRMRQHTADTCTTHRHIMKESISQNPRLTTNTPAEDSSCAKLVQDHLPQHIFDHALLRSLHRGLASKKP